MSDKHWSEVAAEAVARVGILGPSESDWVDAAADAIRTALAGYAIVMQGDFQRLVSMARTYHEIECKTPFIYKTCSCDDAKAVRSAEAALAPQKERT